MTAKSAVNGIDVLFSFDTTGSMYPCLAEVRRKLSGLIERLFGKIAGLRIGVIAHGDYCDERRSYVLKMLDLTSDRSAIVSFVREVGPTDGGDTPECYEYVLHTARSAAWRASRRRVLVMIGDDLPHESRYPLNSKHLDWRNEARLLKQSGIQVYGVQCLNFPHADSFYRELSGITGGLHLHLDQFRHIENLLLGIAYKQDSDEALQAFEREVRTQGPVCYSLEALFDTLSGRRSRAPKTRRDSLVPVDSSRFQIFEVEGQPSIRDFVESMGIRFEKGRGFYPHVTRTETIQETKEVILEDLSTGELFNGDQARRMIGLPYGMRGNIRPNPLPGFRVWVQSTSVNRTLREQQFMYEVPEKARG
jgi:hypothetical protein